MAKFYRSRENALADDDVKTQLTTLGSQTAPGPLLVPGAATHLVGAYVAFTSSGEAADQYASLIRLEGPGIPGQLVNFTAGAGGTSVATGGHSLIPAQMIPLNIPVVANQEILVFAEALGDDMGTYQAGVTLVFSDSAGEGNETKGLITVEGDLTAVDTVVALTSQGSVASPSRVTPADTTVLNKLIVAVASDGAADGEVNYLVRVSGDAVQGGEATFIVAAEGYIDVQAGADPDLVTMKPLILDNLDIPVNGSETIDFDAEMIGVDVGSATIAVTGVFE